jgi:hypothetical protein
LYREEEENFTRYLAMQCRMAILARPLSNAVFEKDIVI